MRTEETKVRHCKPPLEKRHTSAADNHTFFRYRTRFRPHRGRMSRENAKVHPSACKVCLVCITTGITHTLNECGVIAWEALAWPPFATTRAKTRFELDVGGAVAFANYRQTPSGSYHHPYRNAERAARAAVSASELVKGALELIRADGHKVIAGCGFCRGLSAQAPGICRLDRVKTTRSFRVSDAASRNPDRPIRQAFELAQSTSPFTTGRALLRCAGIADIVRPSAQGFRQFGDLLVPRSRSCSAGPSSA